MNTVLLHNAEAERIGFILDGGQAVMIGHSAFVGAVILQVMVTDFAKGQCDPVWEPVGAGRISAVHSLATFDSGAGKELYAGGSFNAVGGIPEHQVAIWDGVRWAVAGAASNASAVNALRVFDDGSGEALYAGGGFYSMGGAVARGIARWNGAEWTSVGGGIEGNVRALATFNDGSGEALFAGGGFQTAGTTNAPFIAKWTGSTWTAFGGSFSRRVWSLTVFDDGTGEALYAGGEMDGSLSRIAKWTGTSWENLGLGTDGTVFAMAGFDDGSGPSLYAGGDFLTAGGKNTSYIAKWDGTSWSQLGAGLNAPVRTMTVHDDGTGSALYVGGDFETAGSEIVNYLAKWDGNEWSSIESGMGGPFQKMFVRSFSEYDDGQGKSLYVGGQFSTAGAIEASNIARWGNPVPFVTNAPIDVTVDRAGEMALFSVEATSPSGPIAPQWHKDGQPVFDDPPHITGSQTLSLMIDSVIRGDEGSYHLSLRNQCGSAQSPSAQLTVKCYVDCDQSTGLGVLDIFDFLCFQSEFVRSRSRADCDGSGDLDIFDFLCFQDEFVAGCP